MKQLMRTESMRLYDISQKKNKSSLSKLQRGVSLIELMVGILIGLMVVAVATVVLMGARQTSGTVSDVSQLQQQASFAFHVIGQQLRQAGSLRLNMAANKPSTTTDIDASDPVAFETRVPGTSGFDPRVDTISGKDSPSAGEYKLTTGYRRYSEPVFGATATKFISSNCVGGPQATTANNNIAIFKNEFVLSGDSLQCSGNGNVQPLVKNVANFTVRYLVQTSPNGNPQIQYLNAASVTNWAQVTGVEVCMVLYGNEPITSSGSTYTDCDGSTSVNTSSLSGARNNRLHMVFKNIFQLRSQGLV